MKETDKKRITFIQVELKRHVVDSRTIHSIYSGPHLLLTAMNYAPDSIFLNTDIVIAHHIFLQTHSPHK